MIAHDSCMIVVFAPSLLMDHTYTFYYMLIVAKSKKEITTLKTQLSSEFGMKDLGSAKKVLGMEITRYRKSSVLFLSQQN
jgi:hypothetical protein